MDSTTETNVRALYENPSNEGAKQWLSDNQSSLDNLNKLIKLSFQDTNSFETRFFAASSIKILAQKFTISPDLLMDQLVSAGESLGPNIDTRILSQWALAIAHSMFKVTTVFQMARLIESSLDTSLPVAWIYCRIATMQYLAEIGLSRLDLADELICPHISQALNAIHDNYVAHITRMAPNVYISASTALLSLAYQALRARFRKDPNQAAETLSQLVSESPIVASDLSIWMRDPKCTALAQELYCTLATWTSLRELYNGRLTEMLVTALYTTMASITHGPPSLLDVHCIEMSPDVLKTCLNCFDAMAGYLLPALMAETNRDSTDCHEIIRFAHNALTYGSNEVRRLSLTGFQSLLSNNDTEYPNCSATLVHRRQVLKPLISYLVEIIFHHVMPFVSHVHMENVDFCNWFEIRDLCCVVLAQASDVVECDKILSLAGDELQYWANVASESGVVPWWRIETCLHALTSVTHRTPAGRDRYIPMALKLLSQMNYEVDGSPEACIILRAAAARLVLWTAGYVGTQNSLFLELLKLLEECIIYTDSARGNLTPSFMNYFIQVEGVMVESLVALTTVASEQSLALDPNETGTLKAEDIHEGIRTISRILTKVSIPCVKRCSLVIASVKLISSLDYETCNSLYTALVRSWKARWEESRKSVAGTDSLKMALTAITGMEFKRDRRLELVMVKVAKDNWALFEAALTSRIESVIEAGCDSLMVLISLEDRDLISQVRELVLDSYQKTAEEPSVYLLALMRKILKDHSKDADEMFTHIISVVAANLHKPDSLEYPDSLGVTIDCLNVGIGGAPTFADRLIPEFESSVKSILIDIASALVRCKHTRLRLTIIVLLNRLTALVVKCDCDHLLDKVMHSFEAAIFAEAAPLDGEALHLVWKGLHILTSSNSFGGKIVQWIAELGNKRRFAFTSKRSKRLLIMMALQPFRPLTGQSDELCGWFEARLTAEDPYFSWQEHWARVSAGAKGSHDFIRQRSCLNWSTLKVDLGEPRVGIATDKSLLICTSYGKKLLFNMKPAASETDILSLRNLLLVFHAPYDRMDGVSTAIRCPVTDKIILGYDSGCVAVFKITREETSNAISTGRTVAKNLANLLMRSVDSSTLASDSSSTTLRRESNSGEYLWRSPNPEERWNMIQLHCVDQIHSSAIESITHISRDNFLIKDKQGNLSRIVNLATNPEFHKLNLPTVAATPVSLANDRILLTSRSRGFINFCLRTGSKREKWWSDLGVKMGQGPILLAKLNSETVIYYHCGYHGVYDVNCDTWVRAPEKSGADDWENIQSLFDDMVAVQYKTKGELKLLDFSCGLDYLVGNVDSYNISKGESGPQLVYIKGLTINVVYFDSWDKLTLGISASVDTDQFGAVSSKLENLYEGSVKLTAIINKNLPSLGLSNTDGLIGNFLEYWEAVIDVQYTENLAAFAGNNLYDLLAIGDEPRPRLHYVFDLYIFSSCLVELIMLSEHKNELLRQYFYRLANRGGLLESILIRIIEAHIMIETITVLPEIFVKALVSLHTERLSTECRICLIDGYKTRLKLAKGVRFRNVKVCSRCAARFLDLLRKIHTHNPVSVVAELNSQMRELKANPAGIIILMDIFKQYRDFVFPLIDILLCHITQLRYQFLVVLNGGEMDLKTLDQLTTGIPGVNVMVWKCVNLFIKHNNLGTHDGRLARVVINNITDVNPHILPLFFGLIESASAKLGFVNELASLLLDDADCASRVLRMLISLSPELTIVKCLIPLIQNHNDPQSIFNSSSKSLNQIILDFQDNQLIEDSQILESWKLFYFSKILTLNLVMPKSFQFSELFDFLINHVQAQARLPVFTEPEMILGYLCTTRDAEETKRIQSAVAENIIYNTVLNDIKIRQRYILYIIKNHIYKIEDVYDLNTLAKQASENRLFELAHYLADYRGDIDVALLYAIELDKPLVTETSHNPDPDPRPGDFRDYYESEVLSSKSSTENSSHTSELPDLSAFEQGIEHYPGIWTMNYVRKIVHDHKTRHEIILSERSYSEKEVDLLRVSICNNLRNILTVSTESNMVENILEILRLIYSNRNWDQMERFLNSSFEILTNKFPNQCIELYDRLYKVESKKMEDVAWYVYRNRVLSNYMGPIVVNKVAVQGLLAGITTILKDFVDFGIHKHPILNDDREYPLLSIAKNLAQLRDTEALNLGVICFHRELAEENLGNRIVLDELKSQVLHLWPFELTNGFISIHSILEQAYNTRKKSFSLFKDCFESNKLLDTTLITDEVDTTSLARAVVYLTGPLLYLMNKNMLIASQFCNLVRVGILESWDFKVEYEVHNFLLDILLEMTNDFIDTDIKYWQSAVLGLNQALLRKLNEVQMSKFGKKLVVNEMINCSTRQGTLRSSEEKTLIINLIDDDESKNESYQTINVQNSTCQICDRHLLPLNNSIPLNAIGLALSNVSLCRSRTFHTQCYH